jgi:hypothetical protein
MLGRDRARRSVVDPAEGILRGSVDLFVGCRRLAKLAHDVVPDWRRDRDFDIVGAVASETDNYPISAQNA